MRDGRDTKNEQGIGQRAEDGKKQAADDSGAENFEQQLAAGREKSGGLEHEETIDQDEEEVAEHSVGAGEEAVGLFARGFSAVGFEEARKVEGVWLSDEEGGGKAGVGGDGEKAKEEEREEVLLGPRHFSGGEGEMREDLKRRLYGGKQSGRLIASHRI